MPIYEYRCSSCGHQNEYLRKITDPLLTECPDCGEESLQKMVTAAGFQLKGSGWYATDFKNPPARQPDKSAAAKSDSEKSDSAKSDSAKSDSAKSDSAKSDSAKPASTTATTGSSAASPAAESRE
jgi:putative FmdB family regulatory protein